MRIKSFLIAAIAVIAVPVASSCGGDDDNGDGGQAANPAPATTETTSRSPSASHALTIRMTEYAFDPKAAVAKAGKVTITAPNNGQIVHELVLLKTDDDPANLPKKGTRSTRARASESSPMWPREQARRGRSSLGREIRNGVRAARPLRERDVWVAYGQVGSPRVRVRGEFANGEVADMKLAILAAHGPPGCSSETDH